MKATAVGGLAICMLWLLGGGEVVQAQVTAKDRDQLAAALTTSDPCCVIDGRSSASRKTKPLADALVYRPDLQIKPTAAVVVIADRDRDAMKIGEALALKHPGKRIIVVKGGVKAWREAARAAQLVAGIHVPGRGAMSFVIPSNTCEQGKPLQELRGDAR